MDKLRDCGVFTHFEETAQGISAKSEQTTATVQFVAEGVVRVSVQNPRARSLPSVAAIAGVEDVDVQIEPNPAGAEIRSAALKVRIEGAPFRVSFYAPDGTCLAEDLAGSCYTGDTGVAHVQNLVPGTHYYGFGEKTGPLDKLGRRMTMWNTDVLPHTPTTDPMYQSIPFFMGLREGQAWGYFYDNTYRSVFDVGHDDEKALIYTADGGDLNYYFIYGPSPREVLKRYSDLTGRMPLPPIWALGYQQCRYSYYPENQVREIAETLRAKHIPADVIYLDIHYMDGYRDFTFDPKRFPDPRGLFADLHAMGFKVVTIVDPGVKLDEDYAVYRRGHEGGWFIRQPNGEEYHGEVWPGTVAFPDFTRGDARTWWGDEHFALLEAGVDGIWDDMNEPSVFNGPDKTMPLDLVQGEDNARVSHAAVHNLYGMMMSRATQEGLRRFRPNERPFVLTRAGYAGIQRYAAVWLGDNSSWWEHIKAAAVMCQGMGISGVPFVGTDVGGFTDDCSGELLARWTALGVFTPFLRNHSAIGTKYQEPWRFGPEVEEICRNLIIWRYRLLPYIYTGMFEASQTGVPFMRALFLDWPEDNEALAAEDEFMAGDSMLVAPVYQPGVSKRAVYLPPGDWYHLWSNQKVTGGAAILADAPLAEIPAYVKSGSIIPLWPAQPYTGSGLVDKVTLMVYPGADGRCWLYQDDGLSENYQRGEYKLSEWTQRTSPSGQTVIRRRVTVDNWQPPYHAVEVVLVNRQAHSVQASAPVEWQYDEEARRTSIYLHAPMSDVEIVID